MRGKLEREGGRVIKRSGEEREWGLGRRREIKVKGG